MAIDDKPTAAWTEADLQELCRERRRENPRLEFKQELSLDTEARKKEAERDVEGLANAGGGHIIYGIAEAQLADGSTAAARLTPLADAGLYERLNTLLDDRGDPRVPFEIYAIDAASGGIYIVVEVHGHRRPHMANDGRYHIRRNLRVRQMTEPEVADAYRQRFERERAALAPLAEAGGADPEERIRRGLDDAEMAAYREETDDPQSPGWLSVYAHPVPLRPNILDLRRFQAVELRLLPVEGLWREHPLAYIPLAKTLGAFVGQLPPEGGYPHYFTRLWPDGLAEYGDLQAPVLREPEGAAGNRIIATHAVAEYVHDFLLYAQALFVHVGYDQEVRARALFDNVEGYRLAVEPQRYLRGDLIVRESPVESDAWDGAVDALGDGATFVAHDISDKIFIAAGQEQGAYFFDADGNYTGAR